MVSFFSKKVSEQETLGEILTAARKQHHFNLKTVAHKLGIREEYLKYLEEGNYQNLPGEIYTKNFLKSYLKFLSLDIEKCLQIYQREKEMHQKIGQSQKEQPRLVERISRRQLVMTPKIFRWGLIVLIIIICLIYLGWEVKKIVTPPFLIIDQPVNNLVTTEYSVAVSGLTEEEAKLTINGQEVLADKTGRFSKKIDLQEGVNVVNISAVKKYSQPNVVYRQVLVESKTGNQ